MRALAILGISSRLRDESLEDASELPEPEELATDAIFELTSAVAELNEIVAMLENADAKGAV